MKILRPIALLIACLTLFSFAACDTANNEKEPTENPTSAPTSAPTEEPTQAESEKNDEYQTITVAKALELCGEQPGNATTERYYIRATVKTVSNPQYGEMTVYDETGEIYVYGTYSADGSKKFSELDEVPQKGDEVLLHCVLQNYNGTKEVQNARLIEFKSNQGSFDVSDYKSATVAEARAAKTGDKLLVSGIVARITYANGMKPSGFILVDGADSIYVYDRDAAGSVKIGNKVEVAGSKTYWILETEATHAATFGYKGCNQLEEVTLVSNDKGEHEWISSAIPTATVKEIMDTPVSEDITTQIYKTTALVKKAPGNGFTNYYIDDLDEKTGSYAYTQCNGSDFSWLDEFDGKICTVYLAVLNAKSTNSGCVYRFLPVSVYDEQFKFDLDNTAQFVAKYHGVTQFDKLYTGDPELKLISTVSSSLLGFDGATLTYSSSDDNVVHFVTTEAIPEETVMHCRNSGTATVTVTASYNGKTHSETVEVSVSISADIPSVSVGDAISAAVGTELTVKGIVGPSLVNQNGFYLIDENGVIAVCMNKEELAKVQLGQEIILKGTRAVRLKDGSGDFGQANLDACEILVNNYGSHDYSTASFIENMTLADVYGLSAKEDHGTEVYVVTATVKVVDAQYYSNIYLVDGDTELLLYCSSSTQYSWLKAYAGQSVTVELAPCNWNSKGSYRGCVLAVRNADGSKVCNELNFNK